MRPAAQGMWSTGLCECCAHPGGCGTCCYTWCCPCCQYGQNVERMPDGDVCCGGSCCGACCCYYIMLNLGCCCFLHMSARAWIRRKYGIPGDCCQDCMTTLCCSTCAMCQEHRELTIRLVQRGGKVLVTPSIKVQPLDGDAREKTPPQKQPAPVLMPPLPQSAAVWTAPAPLPPPPTAQTMQAFPAVPPYTPPPPYGAPTAPPLPPQYQPPPAGYQAVPPAQQPPYPAAPYPAAPYPAQPYAPGPYAPPPPQQQPYGEPTFIQPLPAKKNGKKGHHHHHRRSRSNSSGSDD